MFSLMCIYLYLLFFFFKQKTAYEMRISDWSSDVCSSDLGETDRCLVQSLATCALLRRQGVPCRFAIGVRSRPFAAHAWVELDAQVVNDDLENVRQFTPILVQE